MSTDRKKWLSELKAGDEVAVAGGGWDLTVLIQKIDRVTKTRIFCGQDTFSVSSGYVPGTSFSRRRILPATDERKETARFQALSYWFKTLTPTFQQLEAMKMAFDATEVQV